MKLINVAAVNLGKCNYLASLQLQKAISNKLKTNPGNSIDGVVLLIEYPHLYTVGIRDKVCTIEDENKLRNLGAEFYKTDRGGLITYHGPGQLVVYPILNLKCWHRVNSVRWYVGTLEETVINLAKCFGIIANRDSTYPGIWVGDKKLCSLGVHVSRHITTHGIAINCSTNLNWFGHIVPCGIEGKGITSFSELLRKELTIENILPSFFRTFEQEFNCKLHHFSDNKLKEFLEDVPS